MQNPQCLLCLVSCCFLFFLVIFISDFKCKGCFWGGAHLCGLIITWQRFNSISYNNCFLLSVASFIIYHFLFLIPTLRVVFWGGAHLSGLIITWHRTESRPDFVSYGVSFQTLDYHLSFLLYSCWWLSFKHTWYLSILGHHPLGL